MTGPKDLPVIARTAGRFAGRAIAYVQLARGQFDSVMQQSQARQVLFSAATPLVFMSCLMLCYAIHDMDKTVS